MSDSSSWGSNEEDEDVNSTQFEELILNGIEGKNTGNEVTSSQLIKEGSLSVQNKRSNENGVGDAWRNSNTENVCFDINSGGGDQEKAKEVGEAKKPITYCPVETEICDAMYSSGISRGTNFDKYKEIPVEVMGKDATIPFDSINDANFRPLLLENVLKCRFTQLTPVQRYAMPVILASRDLIACAQTGSGKTVAFLLPIIHRLLEQDPPIVEKSSPQTPLAVIITPTRELAIQIKDETRKLCNGSWIRTLACYGGTSVHYLRSQITRSRLDILVSTPGRLLDFINKSIVSFKKVRFIVLDEADRMLDMGFFEDIQKIIQHPDTPAKNDRQMLMFSATFPFVIRNVARNFLHNYLFVKVGGVGTACDNVCQTILQVKRFDKESKLVEILKDIQDESPDTRTLIFVAKRTMADYLACQLCEKKFDVTSIHGDRYQEEREIALNDFKTGKRPILVATDVVARGIDIRSVAHVINYNMPRRIEEYVHRIGRTGRIGNLGTAISFYDPQVDSFIAQDLIKVLNNAQQHVPEWLTKANSNMQHDQTASSCQDGADAVSFASPNTPIVDQEEEAWD